MLVIPLASDKLDLATRVKEHKMETNDNGMFAAFNVLNDIDDWHAKATVWLNSDNEQRESLIDPEESKPTPLDRMIRHGWQSIMHGSEATATCYQLLMSCGGPAIRIVGVLNDQCEAVTVELQFQAGLFERKWTKVETDSTASEALLAYANSFHWG